MAREGTRSQTGHSKPRVIEQISTDPVIKRKPAARKKKAPAVKGAKPTGVKKPTAKKPATMKTTTKKEPGAAAKVCFLSSAANTSTPAPRCAASCREGG